MSFMSVKVYHGVSTKFHALEHKPQRICGLKDCLEKLGFQVHLVEVPYIDYCVLVMCDHEVFCCNLQHLKFNTHYSRDPVAQRAVAAVLEASELFQRGRRQLWLGTLIQEEIFKRGPYAPKDYWPVDVEVKPYATCSQCVACCDILVKKKDINDPTSV